MNITRCHYLYYIIEELTEMLVTCMLSSAMKSFTCHSLRHLKPTEALVSQLNLRPSINSFVPKKKTLRTRHPSWTAELPTVKLLLLESHRLYEFKKFGFKSHLTP